MGSTKFLIPGRPAAALFEKTAAPLCDFYPTQNMIYLKYNRISIENKSHLMHDSRTRVWYALGHQYVHMPL